MRWNKQKQIPCNPFRDPQGFREHELGSAIHNGGFKTAVGCLRKSNATHKQHLDEPDVMKWLANNQLRRSDVKTNWKAGQLCHWCADIRLFGACEAECRSYVGPLSVRQAAKICISFVGVTGCEYGVTVWCAGSEWLKCGSEWHKCAKFCLQSAMIRKRVQAATDVTQSTVGAINMLTGKHIEMFRHTQTQYETGRTADILGGGGWGAFVAYVSGRSDLSFHTFLCLCFQV